MSIQNSVAKILPGMGSGVTFQNLNVQCASGSTICVLPNTGNFSPPLSMGKVRVQDFTVGVNSTIKIANIVRSDGNNTVVLYGGDSVATVSNQHYCTQQEFICDYNLLTCNVTVTVTGGTAGIDLEVCGDS